MQAQAQSSLHQHLAIDDDVVIAFVHVSPLDSAVAPGRLAQHHGVVNGIRIWRVVGVAVRRWNFDCGADYTGIAIVGIAAATVVGPVPPALPLPPTIPETLCGYPVDIDSPNPKTGANPVRDIPLDPGHPAPAAAANIKFPPPDPNVPSPPPLRAKHKPSHDFWRYLDREWQLELDSDLMFGSDSEPAATPIEDQSLNVWITVDSHNPYDTPGEYGAQGSTNSCKEENPMGFKGVWVVE
ncbi:hypothetical protein BU17DRAFT_72266 [Hysterangium stoloniferum]|nr:hypothetical protein BU17DRAFT_72266 [Hysterangium stoloniferum]